MDYLHAKVETALQMNQQSQACPLCLRSGAEICRDPQNRRPCGGGGCLAEEGRDVEEDEKPTERQRVILSRTTGQMSPTPFQCGKA